MTKLLLALDCSSHSRRAAQYVAAIAPHLPDATVVLFSVLSGVPYSEAELASGTPVLPPEVHGDEDRALEVSQVRGFLEEIASLLQAQGMPSERLQIQFKPLRRGIALDIIDECTVLGCDTIVVGRRGLSRVGGLLLGSTSRDIVQKASGQAIWIVD